MIQAKRDRHRENDQVLNLTAEDSYVSKEVEGSVSHGQIVSDK